MTTYWHVAPATYQHGEDLLSYDIQVDRGLDVTWKWGDEYVDTFVVCLFADTESGREERDEYVSEYGGQMLRIVIPEDDDEIEVTRVAEGYAAVAHSIPASYVKVIS